MIRIASRATGGALTLALAVTAAVAVVPSAPAGATGGTHRVSPGQSIQAAIDEAHPGDRVVVRTGTYAEQLTISTDGISLVGHGAVLVPPMAFEQNTCTDLAGDGTEAGICVTGTGVELAEFVAEHRRVESVADPVEDVTVAGFEVRGFSGANIAFVGAADARLTGNRLVDGLVYGTLTAGSTNTRFTGNRVSSTHSLGFIGMCMDDTSPSLLARNEVRGYGVGLCIQTHGATVAANQVHQNCIGIYVDPGISGVRVRLNRVRDTNPRCVGDNPFGNYGIILAGAVGADVRGNWVEGQRAGGSAVGVAVVDASPTGPFATGNTVQHNVIVDNDLDVLVDTVGTGNVVARNHCETSTPEAVCD